MQGVRDGGQLPDFRNWLPTRWFTSRERWPRHDSYGLKSIKSGVKVSDTKLLKVLYSNAENLTDTQDGAIEYYQLFIRSLEAHFNSLLDSYREVGSINGVTGVMTFASFQNIASSICTELSIRKHVSVAELADTLMKNGLVTKDESHSKKIQQLVFTTIGMLSMLFAPSATPVEGVLSIEVPELNSSRRRASDTWVVTQQPLGDASCSIGDVLRRFSGKRGPLYYIDGSATHLNEVDMLMSSNLNFYTLARLGGLKIHWVDSVCMHLELNRREKILMVFRSPSFCAMLSQGRDRGIFLDRVFNDYFTDLHKDLKRTSPAGDFFKEVLLTYRLIFGQDKRSWKLCNKIGASNDPRNNKGIIDPLLHKLCCCDWETEPLYDEIDVPDARSLYSAQQDFPFFGEKLMVLQEYTRLLEPHDWRSLYADRRNMNRFCTIWAVIFFGIITLVLTFIGLGIGAAQVAGSFKPSAPPTPTG